MSKKLTRGKILLIVVLGVIITLLMDHFVWKDNIVGEPTVSYSALHLKRMEYPTCTDTDRYCTYHGSGWNDYGVQNASKAGKIGPHYVAVPAKVRSNIRAAVFKRGSTFTARVRKSFKQFDHTVWKVNCAMVLGTWAARKYADPKLRMLPRCLTGKQMLATLGTKVWKPALKCGGDAFIVSGTGAAVARSGKGAVIGALVGAVTCGVQGTWDYYVDSGEAQADAGFLWHGFKSLTVAQAKALHYMF